MKSIYLIEEENIMKKIIASTLVVLALMPILTMAQEVPTRHQVGEMTLDVSQADLFKNRLAPFKDIRF